MIKKILLAFAIGILASCSIEHHIHVKENGSGFVELKMDYSMLKGLASMSLDTALTEGSDSSSNYLDSFAQSFSGVKATLMNIPGISDVQSEFNEELGQMSIRYKYASIDALNKAITSPMFGEDFAVERNVKPYTKSKKEFSYLVEGNAEDPMKDLDESTAMMYSMMSNKLIISFDQQIKSCSDTSFKVSSDKHSVVYEGSDFMKTLGIGAVNLKLKLK